MRPSGPNNLLSRSHRIRILVRFQSRGNRLSRNRPHRTPVRRSHRQQCATFAANAAFRYSPAAALALAPGRQTTWRRPHLARPPKLTRAIARRARGRQRPQATARSAQPPRPAAALARAPAPAAPGARRSRLRDRAAGAGAVAAEGRGTAQLGLRAPPPPSLSLRPAKPPGGGCASRPRRARRAACVHWPLRESSC
jgi:hypothetical protein